MNIFLAYYDLCFSHWKEKGAIIDSILVVLGRNFGK